MPRLYYVFSNIKALLEKGGISYKKHNSSFPMVYRNNDANDLNLNTNLEGILSRLSTLKSKVQLVEKVSRTSSEYSYFKGEYIRGSFMETDTGDLLIPSDTVSLVKEKVR